MRKKSLERLDRSRLAREYAKLDPKVERAMAEEGMSRELAEWPTFSARRGGAIRGR